MIFFVVAAVAFFFLLFFSYNGFIFDILERQLNYLPVIHQSESTKPPPKKKQNNTGVEWWLFPFFH